MEKNYIGNFGGVPLWMWIHIIKTVADRVVSFGL